MARYFLEVSYDGTLFHGSQLQGDLPTVQLSVNKTLSTLLRRPVESFGASRTDEGVHALSNFYHFDAEEELNPHFHYKFNAILPEGIALKNIFLANNPEMNARFAATSRRYRYRVYRFKNPFLLNRAYFFPYRLDRALLDSTAASLKEYTLFESFSKRNTQSKTFLCTIHQSYWEEQGEELHYIVEANRFLRGMVRGLVGTQLRLSRSRRELQDFRNIIEAQDCTLADFSVPGSGLYLEAVSYPPGSLTRLDLM